MATKRGGYASGNGTRRVAAVVVASLVGAAVFGAVLDGTGRLESVAGLYGMSGVANGWLLLTGHSVLAVLGFGVVTVLLSPVRLATVFGGDGTLGVILAGIVLGVVYGAVVWTVVIAVGIPLWFDVVLGAERPFPYLHEVSLAGLLLFGAVIGGSYSAFLPSMAIDEPRVGADQ